MALFVSGRERRLWLWTLAIIVAIYATLGLAGTIAEVLGEGGFLDAILFLLGMALVGVTVLAHGLGRGPRGGEIVIALGVATVYFMALFRMTLAERSHLIEYGVVAVLILEALGERASQSHVVRAPALLAIVSTGLVGALDEGIQLFLPSRVFDPVDIVFNFLAAAMAVGASLALGWVRRPKRRRRT
jgi:hypothetical protein